MKGKFKDRKEQKEVTEAMNALLLPLLHCLDNCTVILVRRALYLLGEIEIEPQENEADVLDEIRAEVKAKIVKRPWLDFKDRERDRNDAFLEVLDIIDKHKAESEVGDA